MHRAAFFLCLALFASSAWGFIAPSSSSSLVFTSRVDGLGYTHLCAKKQGKKRRRRVDGPSDNRTTEKKSIPVEALEAPVDTSYSSDISQLFDDDWSGMQTPEGMATKPKQALPDLQAWGEKEEASSAAPSGALSYESKLSPLSGMGEPTDERSWAEKFAEGSIIGAAKTATWAAILAAVAWEIYIHSPLFHPPTQ